MLLESGQDTIEILVMLCRSRSEHHFLSEIFLHPGTPVSISSIAFWKISDAAFIRDMRLLYLLRAQNVVIWRLSGYSSSLWYLEERSSLLKTVAPF